MTLGPRLKELREAAGLSQTKLAEVAGVSRNAVSQWEAGTTQPSTKRLSLISRALKVPIDQMMSPSSAVRSQLIEVATRLFDRLGFEDTSNAVICATADITEAELNTLYPVREVLLYEVLEAYTERTLSELRRTPPKYGSVSARLKYVLRTLAAQDLGHLKLATELHAQTWRWSEARERAYTRQMSEFHDTIIALFEEAVTTRQIRPGHFRAASGLLHAAYVAALRRALFERMDADKLIGHIEPQLAMILTGFGFAEDDTAT